MRVILAVAGLCSVTAFASFNLAVSPNRVAINGASKAYAITKGAKVLGAAFSHGVLGLQPWSPMLTMNVLDGGVPTGSNNEISVAGWTVNASVTDIACSPFTSTQADFTLTWPGAGSIPAGSSGSKYLNIAYSDTECTDLSSGSSSISIGSTVSLESNCGFNNEPCYACVGGVYYDGSTEHTSSLLRIGRVYDAGTDTCSDVIQQL